MTDAPRERRHAFGDDAEQYDAARPGYPAQLTEDVLRFAAPSGAAPALEVGAGTGKATLAFAARGLPVTCVEPDARMARVLRLKCAGLPGVDVEGADFETWRPGGRRYGLLYCAQAWHWVDPAVRWTRARAALRPGGALALFWNHWFLEDARLARQLTAAHARQGVAVPDHTLLEPRPRPAHRGPAARQWREMEADGGFTDLEHRLYETEHECPGPELVGLLASYSGYRMLAEPVRRPLLAEAERIAGGDAVLVRVVTSLFLARTKGARRA
ncbi:class I SAM-dependent methyltransferase [Streptomyces sp. NPDC049577]|uniref:class I SAM-dependent methyltransferase n=1 Tax=Streptomyces sp. NPDC049577 TaxID=3155153 RepID=UPI00343F5E3B